MSERSIRTTGEDRRVIRPGTEEYKKLTTPKKEASDTKKKG